MLQSLLTLFISSILFVIAYGQNLKVIPYNNEHGLFTNLIKDAEQDKDGFIWLATDAGVVKFNGRQFITITKGLPSLYVKDICVTPDNKIIAVNDLGAGTIEYRDGSYYYLSIIKGDVLESDSLLYYPKSIFIDKSGTIWISEKNSISRLTGNRIKKYNFDEQYHTDSYQQSFQFSEGADGNITVVSWRGYFFHYDKGADKFIPLDFTPPNARFYINQFEEIAENTYLAAAANGILKIEINKRSVSIKENLIPLTFASCFQIVNSEKIYAGTWFNGMYLWNKAAGTFNIINDLQKVAIAKMTRDREGSIWVSSDDGLRLIQETYFTPAEYDKVNSQANTFYILNVISSKQGSIYFTDQNSIYKIEKSRDGYHYKKIIDSKNRRIIGFDINYDAMWISYRDGDLEFNSSKFHRIIKADAFGGRLSALHIDNFGNLWGYQDEKRQIYKIDPYFNIKSYTLEDKYALVNVIKSGMNHETYFGAAGTENVVFSYDYNNDKIVPLIHSKDFNVNSDLHIAVNDIEFLNDNTVWIGSNAGLYKYEQNKLKNTRFPLTYENLIVKSLREENNRLWIGTDIGLIMYYEGQFINYSKQEGLPNTTISERSIAVDKDGVIWTGTVSGLAHWQRNFIEIKKTSPPRFIEIKFNDELTSQDNIPELTGASELRINFVSLSFPDKVEYQIRLLGLNNEWSLPASQNSFVFPGLPPGEYAFQVRAKQSGQMWSDISEVKFTILQPFYYKWWMIVVYSIILLGLIYLLISLYEKRKFVKLEKKQRELIYLVEERTKDLKAEKEKTEQLLSETKIAKEELEMANTDLRKANNLKSDLLSIAAHDLKNPLSNIIGYSTILKEEAGDNKTFNNFADIIYSSSMRMLDLITDILESVAVESTKLRMNKKVVSLTSIAGKVIQNNLPQCAKKRQTIIFNNDKDILALADDKWIKEAMDNLVSNAIKYSPLNSQITVKLERADDKALFSVKDDGPGITAEDKKNLFKKFVRLSAHPTGGESSTGLGLSIAKEIVTLHGGRIWANGENGKGSTFIFEIEAL